MRKRIILSVIVVLFVMACKNAWSAPVKISGKAPDYSLNTIELNVFHDFISEEKEKLGTFRMDASGNFELTVELTETSLCFADFDGYHGMIYLEPGKTYQLIFPPKRNLTESQKRNPFVKPDPVWLGILNTDKEELNFRIQQFENSYINYENKYFDQIFVNKSKSLVDTVKTKLDKEFPPTNQKFFELHKFFRKANLEFALHQGRSAEFMETFFSSTKPVYNLEAYSALFDQVFTNYFSNLANSPHNSEIGKLVNSSALQQLDEYFQKQLHFNTALSHWVLLKSMKDAYYSNQFSKASVLKMLDEVQNSGWSVYEKETAKFIHSKLTYLTSGTKPPEIVLKDLNGKKVSFSDFSGSYIYLQFTDPANIICRQHLDELKTIASHYKEKLVIINVIPKNQAFKNDRNWPGIFTTTNDNLEETYKVKTFPNAFLIGKDGKLLLSPAPNPIDGLDRQLGQLFKSDYFREMRKNNSKSN